jgi:predicted transcriptional regulator with HTH domain
METRMKMKLTEIDSKVLKWMGQVYGPSTYVTPAEIGRAMGGTISGKSQGLGRMGGRRAKRLIGMGFVEDVSSLMRGGFPAYRITALGRSQLAR